MPAFFAQLSFLLAAILAVPAHAAPVVTGGSAAPQKLFLQSPDAREQVDPRIGRPVAPSVDCIPGDLTAQEMGNIREKAGIKNIGKACLPQQDSFKQAAEASSYLAIYQEYFSDYGNMMRDPAKKKEIQAAVQACIANDPRCNSQTVEGRAMRADLLKALVQANFGKELKAETIENQSRAERMKSMDFYLKPDKSQGVAGIPTKVLSWNNSLHTERVAKNSFRLDPAQVKAYDLEKFSATDRMLLGKEFNEGFNDFVNEYTSSTGQKGPKSRWHYVEAKSSALTGQAVTIAAYDNRNLDAREGKSAVDGGLLRADIKSQESRDVQDIVDSYRKQYKDVLATPKMDQVVTDRTGKDKDPKKVQVDSIQLAYSDTGFGLPRAELDKINSGIKDAPRNPKDVADLVVVSINRAITKTEDDIAKHNAAMNERMPSSAGRRSTIVPSVTVDMQRFDAFLNDIWPSSAETHPPQVN